MQRECSVNAREKATARSLRTRVHDDRIDDRLSHAVYMGPIDSCGGGALLKNVLGPPLCQALRAPPSPHPALPYGSGVKSSIGALPHAVQGLSHHGCGLAMATQPYHKELLHNLSSGGSIDTRRCGTSRGSTANECTSAWGNVPTLIASKTLNQDPSAAHRRISWNARRLPHTHAC